MPIIGVANRHVRPKWIDNVNIYEDGDKQKEK